MTSIVALRCSDGVVIGADSAVTFGSSGGRVLTIEQHTSQKIRIIGNRVILAGTGQVGLMQRFHAALERESDASTFDSIETGIEFGKKLSDIGLRDFNDTNLRNIEFSAFVAFVAGGQPYLCELDGDSHFQPELKEPTDLWYVSSGIGQQITDPFLALLREAFWSEGPPNLRGGIFTALWALKHVCKINAGGIGDPVNIAVLDQNAGNVARMLTAEELAEHDNVVEGAMKHLGSFRDILEGKSITAPPPKISISKALLAKKT